MKLRKFGRTNWQVSEIGYGMWGMGGDWKGTTDDQHHTSLDLAVELGCNFFDTAWGYGSGKSEQLLAALMKRHPSTKIWAATKIPPMNFKWPSQRGFLLKDCFPAKHIKEYTEKSLKNLALEKIDLIQFHVWEDSWANQEEWQRALEDLKTEGKIDAVGISVNRWEPENCLNSIRTGAIDSIQVIYNIFDQAPEDELFPLCEEMDIAVIARVPFDEGTLTGKLTKETTFAKDDWRGTYFVPENLNSSVDHAEQIKKDLPEGLELPEAALRFILENPIVSSIIPGMRQARHVKANCACSDGKKLPSDLVQKLKSHRWDREPTTWSQ